MESTRFKPNTKSNENQGTSTEVIKRKFSEVSLSPRNVEDKSKKLSIPKTSELVNDLIRKYNIAEILQDLQKAPTVTDKLQLLQHVSSISSKLREVIISAEPIKFDDHLAPHISENNAFMPKELQNDFSLLETEGDGRCLYYSISWTLFGSPVYAAAIKLLVLDHCLRFFQQLINVAPKIFSLQSEPATAENLLLHHSKIASWGDEFTLYAVSEALKRPVISLGLSTYLPQEKIFSAIFNFSTTDLKKKAIFVTLKSSHFEALLPLKDQINSVKVETCVNLLSNLGNAYEVVKTNAPPQEYEVSESEIIVINQETSNNTSNRPNYNTTNSQARSIQQNRCHIPKPQPSKVNSQQNFLVPDDVNSVIAEYDDLRVVRSEFLVEIICVPCHLNGNKKATFSFPNPDSFESSSDRNHALRNLRKSFKRHFSNSHTNKKQIEYSLSDQEKKKIGLRLAKCAYLAVKKDHSHLQYEYYVATEAASGNPIGDFNHGRHFSTQFAATVYHVLCEKLLQLLSEPIPATKKASPISIIVDKYTASNQTGQIVGLICIVDGKPKDYFLKDSKVSGSTGIELGKLLHQSLTSVNITDEKLLSRLCSGAGDGEYQKKNIFSSFMKSLGANDEQSKWFTFEWDTPHKLQRCIEDSRNNKLLLKFNQVSKTVHSINKMYRHSQKNFRKLEEAAERLGLKLYKPIQEVPTRFLAYQHNVLLNFWRNYAIYREVLEEGTQAAKDITLFSFVGFLSMVLDIFNVLAELSAECQKVGEFPWNISDNISETFETLDMMLASLPDNKQVNYRCHGRLKYLQECLNEVNMTSRFRGCLVNSKEFETVLETLKVEAKIFILSFKESFWKRSPLSGPNVNEMITACFRLEQLADSGENGVVPKQFYEYLALGKLAGYIRTSLSEDELGDQYLRMAVIANELYRKSLNTTGLRPTFKELEKSIFRSILIRQNCNFEVAADLLASAIVRTQAEASVETMGSKVKKIVENRPIKFANMDKELFIAYNGPKPYAKGVEIMLEESLNRYFEGKLWHFFKTKKSDKKFQVSKVVDRKDCEASQKDRLTF